MAHSALLGSLLLLARASASVRTSATPHLRAIRSLASTRRSVSLHADEPGASAASEGGVAAAPAPLTVVDSAEGTKYAVCSRCGAVYAVDEALFRGKGAKVKCAVCSNNWFQLTERLVEKPETFELATFPAERMVERPAVLDSPRSGGVMNIYVGNMPFTLSDVDLADMFAPFGTVTKIMLMRDEIGRSKGFGFVEMASVAEGEQAILALNDRDFGGRSITVAAREMRPTIDRVSRSGGGGNMRGQGGGGGGGGGGPRGPPRGGPGGGGGRGPPRD